MNRRVEELYRAAADLSESDRAELAGLLLESLESEGDQDVEVAWAQEIERRVREIETGEVTTIPWEEVRATLHARLAEKR
ncbi:MAG: addiction module protein [Thermoanaerobaculia bacterium]